MNFEYYKRLLGSYFYYSKPLKDTEMMETPSDYTHIGMYDIKQCEQVVKISLALLQSRGKEPYPYEKGL